MSWGLGVGGFEFRVGGWGLGEKTQPSQPSQPTQPTQPFCLNPVHPFNL